MIGPEAFPPGLHRSATKGLDMRQSFVMESIMVFALVTVGAAFWRLAQRQKTERTKSVASVPAPAPAPFSRPSGWTVNTQNSNVVIPLGQDAVSSDMQWLLIGGL